MYERLLSALISFSFGGVYLSSDDVSLTYEKLVSYRYVFIAYNGKEKVTFGAR